jgi:PPOX class probable F420-dependent enzyme
MSYPESHLDLLNAPGVGILSTHTPNGLIQSTAIWYLLDDDGELKISVSDARKKVRNLQDDSTATFFLLDPANPFRFIEVRGTSNVTVDEGYAFRSKVGAKYGTDMATFDTPDAVRYVITLIPATVTAQ